MLFIDWNKIDTVLLDMDGTLLDRHFDDHFWLEHLPKRWSEKEGVALDEAKNYLYPLFRSKENTLAWTDLDYWSDRLSIDIPVLKMEVEHLIAVHPYVAEFLTFLKHHSKKCWLVTNAHSKTLELKMRKTLLGPYFDGIISAHQVGISKEDCGFWKKLLSFIQYDPSRTMLAEDSEANLESAEKFRIAYLIYVSCYSSALPPKPSGKFTSVNYFNRLIPDSGETSVTLM